jgi:hypothetical protein
MSTAMASMALRRWSTSMKASLAPLTPGLTGLASFPIKSTASWNKQWACTSTVLMRLPLTITGKVRPAGCSALAAPNEPQL